jgi:hypothetical protein
MLLELEQARGFTRAASVQPVLPFAEAAGS